VRAVDRNAAVPGQVSVLLTCMWVRFCASRVVHISPVQCQNQKRMLLPGHSWCFIKCFIMHLSSHSTWRQTVMRHSTRLFCTCGARHCSPQHTRAPHNTHRKSLTGHDVSTPSAQSTCGLSHQDTKPSAMTHACSQKAGPGRSEAMPPILSFPQPPCKAASHLVLRQHSVHSPPQRYPGQRPRAAASATGCRTARRGGTRHRQQQ